MVDNLLIPDLRLTGLLWRGLILYEGWARSRAAACPTTRKQAPPIPTHSRDPPPFPGLPRNPRCTAWEQTPEPSSPAPLAPPPFSSTPGRPRQVDTSGQFCPQSRCPYYGWVGLGTLRANGYPSGGRWRQCQWLGCKQYFLAISFAPLRR